MHDVFISYSSIDKYLADAVCSRLESGGVKCWYAPRDIEPGEDWAGAIMQAIRQSRVFVLIYSTNSNQSKQVVREVAAAVESECTIVPFRIDGTAMSANLSYYLSGIHWMDALQTPMEQGIEDLYTRVWWLIHPPQLPQTEQRPETVYQPWQQPGQTPAKKKSRKWILVLAAIVVLAVAAILTIRDTEDSSTPTEGTQANTAEPEPPVAQVQTIWFERISHYDDFCYPFSDFTLFSDSMDAYFLENLETGDLWLWKTDTDTPIIDNIPALPWDPYWQRAIVTDSKEFVYFVDELYGMIQCYDTVAGNWRWEETASLNLSDTEYINILRNQNYINAESADDVVACFLIYDAKDEEARYTRVVKLYPDGSTKNTDIRHLNLVTYIADIDRIGSYAVAMLDKDKNVKILDLTSMEVPALSNEVLLQDYLQYNNGNDKTTFFNKTGRYLCTLTQRNGREYYTVRNMETGRTNEYNYDYADVCFVEEDSLLVFNREDYSLTVYNLENNRATQLLDQQYFLENDAYSALPNIFYYLEELDAFCFLSGTDDGCVITITDVKGDILAQSQALETPFEQNDVSCVLKNNEIFLSIRSQTYGEALEHDTYGSVYNVIYRAKFTYNAQGELIFIQ